MECVVTSDVIIRSGSSSIIHFCDTVLTQWGRQYCPPDFWLALQQKQEEPVTWIFLTFTKYVYTLTSKKKKCNVNPDRPLRGVLNRPVKIFCTYSGHIYIFYDVLFRFFHVRCLNILKFGHRFHFWDRKKIWCILTNMLFSRSILTIFDRPFYIARDCAPVTARMIPNVWMKSTKHQNKSYFV